MGKVQQLKQALLPAESALIITHDYPDPDSLAAAFGLSRLFSFWGIKNVMITFGGFIGRAENRAMVKLLGIDALPLPLVYITDYQRVVVVDSLPHQGNIGLSEQVKVDAVIDHHLNKPDANAPYFHDIRKEAGATAAIITEYLIETGCPIDSDLATALYYGIKTDTHDLSVDFAPEDLQAYRFLFDKLDNSKLYRIENPELERQYFTVLHEALEAFTIYRKVGHAHLGTVGTPDFIAEMADMFARLKELEWMLCSGICKGVLYFSLRSTKSREAGRNARAIAQHCGGSGGGHEMIAAGQIPLQARDDQSTYERFVEVFKDIFELQEVPPQRVVRQ